MGKEKEMTLNEYQDKAMTTCMETCNNDMYMLLNLVGEVGEMCSKIAKGIRKGFVSIDFNNIYVTSDAEAGKREEFLEGIMLEAGDCAWQLSGFCSTMSWKLDNVYQANLDKLKARKSAGTISGNGDGVSGAERKADT